MNPHPACHGVLFLYLLMTGTEDGLPHCPGFYRTTRDLSFSLQAGTADISSTGPSPSPSLFFGRHWIPTSIVYIFDITSYFAFLLIIHVGVFYTPITDAGSSVLSILLFILPVYFHFSNRISGF